MTTPPPIPTTPQVSILDKILMYLEIAAEVGASIPGPIGVGSALAAKLVSIAVAADNAHKALTGQPIDLTKLHSIDPVA